MKTLLPATITKDQLVKEIVARDYRAASVFEKLEIGYCCGGNWSLESVCLMKGIEVEKVIADIQNTTRNIQISPIIPFEKWNIDFLIDHIIHIHHYYLKQTLPEIDKLLTRFVRKHEEKLGFPDKLLSQYHIIQTSLFQRMEEEETVIFPYIRHLNHAYESNDSYAGLLVKTLRKPIPKVVANEHDIIHSGLHTLRQLTSDYSVPPKACTSHHVVFSKLAELDNDITQHLFLENETLFPKVLIMEKELLQRK